MTSTNLSFSKNTWFVDAPPTGADGGKLVKFAPLPWNAVAVTTPALPALILLPISNCPLLNVNPRLCKFDTPVMKFDAVNIPVTTAPVFVVTNLVLLLKFNVCPPPEENIADVLLPAKFVISNVPDLSLKLPYPWSSI